MGIRCNAALCAAGSAASGRWLCDERTEEEEEVTFDGEAERERRSLGVVGLVLPLSPESVKALLRREEEQLLGEDYVGRLRDRGLESIRSDAIDWMLKLVSVACLSIAAKMEENEVPLPLELQIEGDARYMFESRTVQRMELLVLTTLKWRMQLVTPFSFVAHFLEWLSCGSSANPAMITRCADLIFSIVKGIGFLSFRPSEIAAAVAALTVKESRDFRPSHCNTSNFILDERVTQCCEMIGAATASSPGRPNAGDGNPSAKPQYSSSLSLVLQSPSGVWDAAACLTSSMSVSTISGSPVTSKRRRPSPLSPA